MRPLVVHCHLGLGRLFGQTRREEAVQHLDTAAELFCDMDMTFWPTRSGAPVTSYRQFLRY